MLFKVCKGCGVSKPLVDYYPHPQMSDGTINYCKLCHSKKQRDHRKKDIEAARFRDGQQYRRHRDAKLEWQRAYHTTERGRAVRAESTAKWDAKNKDKQKAHRFVRAAVKTGRLSKPSSCEVCGATGIIHAHHDDYSRPLNVVWLCPKHHSLLHVGMRDIGLAF